MAIIVAFTALTLILSFVYNSDIGEEEKEKENE